MSAVDAKYSPGGSTGAETVELQEVDPFLPQHSCECQHTEYVKHKRKPDHPMDNHRPWWRPIGWRRFSKLDRSPQSSSPSPPTSDGVHSPSPQRCHPLRNTEIHLKTNGKQAKAETVLLPNDTSHSLETNAIVAINQKATVESVENDGGASAAGPSRETWDKRIDFLLSIIGFAVDLANVWRFPYLCYRNGGGAFLIPYFLMLIFGALPLFYMELLLGQYHRQGPISIWKICPLFKGAGYCAVLVAFYVSFYYNVIIGWSFHFMFSSFNPVLPWTHCNNTWNSLQCWDRSSRDANQSDLWTSTNRSSAAIEYFEREVLDLSPGVHDFGAPKWQLCLCVLLVYSILYMALFKGVKSSGKVVWVTATMPYVVLSILLVRGLMLPGSVDGILYFIWPNMEKLTEPRVWGDAAVQVFYSVGAGFGVHLTFSSYNTFHNNCFKDCLITTSINTFTSLFSGVVIFTYLGYMANYQNRDISQVATDGPGLVFQVYPEAIATLPGSHVWAFIFFFMLITLGMDSTMGGLESVITGFKDEFHNLFAKHRYSREIFTAIIMLISFTISTVNLTRAGGYMVHWFDTYSAGVSLLCSALFEAIGISWFYGIERFSEDVKEMLGSTPGKFWRICWKFVSPFFIVAVIISNIVYHPPLTYNTYVYPTWSELAGWAFAMSSVAAIPIVGAIVLFRQKGDTCKEKFAYSITPLTEHHMVSTGQLTRFQFKHWFSI